MIEMSIGSLIAMMGIPTAVTGFFFWLLEHRIQKREKKREQQEATARAKAEEREHAREELQLLAIQSTNAAIALAEATAKAVQRIPDAKCNGDMHAALDYAAKVKHEQKDFFDQAGDPSDPRVGRRQTWQPDAAGAGRKERRSRPARGSPTGRPSWPLSARSRPTHWQPVGWIPSAT